MMSQYEVWCTISAVYGDNFHVLTGLFKFTEIQQTQLYSVMLLIRGECREEVRRSGKNISD